MPIYLYQCPYTEQVKEVYQSMNEDHRYSEDDVEWNRIFTVPQAQIDGKINCWSVNKFVEKTSKPDTYGALIERSSELSQKRAEQNGGVDPIRAKAEKDYSRLRKGRKYVSRIE
jgi:hypothetical protein